jgi:hypothetical protein
LEAEPADELQREILRLVQRLEDDAGARGIFKALCQLARKYRVAPDTYRSYLVKAGLWPSRASEIKAVLERPGVCDPFLEGKVSWKKSLAAAREFNLGPVRHAARRLIQLLFRNGPALAASTTTRNWRVEQCGPGHFRFHDARGTLELQTVLPAIKSL